MAHSFSLDYFLQSLDLVQAQSPLRHVRTFLQIGRLASASIDGSKHPRTAIIGREHALDHRVSSMQKPPARHGRVALLTHSTRLLDFVLLLLLISHKLQGSMKIYNLNITF